MRSSFVFHFTFRVTFKASGCLPAGAHPRPGWMHGVGRRGDPRVQGRGWGATLPRGWGGAWHPSPHPAAAERTPLCLVPAPPATHPAQAECSHEHPAGPGHALLLAAGPALASRRITGVGLAPAPAVCVFRDVL